MGTASGTAPLGATRGGRAERRVLLKAAVAAAAVALLLTACGGDDSTASVDTASDSTPTTAPTPTVPTTTTLPPGEFKDRGVWTWQWEDPNGYRTDGTLTLGAATRMEAAPVLPGANDYSSGDGLDGLCGLDPQTTAVIPAKLELKNSSSGSYSNTLSNNLYLASKETTGALIQEASDQLLGVAALYSDGPDCHPLATADGAFMSNGTGWTLKFNEPVSDGQTVEHYAYLYLPDYYGPNHPNGDLQRLDTVGLAFLPQMQSTDGTKLNQFDGPDPKLFSQQYGAWTGVLYLANSK